MKLLWIAVESFIDEGENLALGKTAYASQTRKNWTADKAVDGNKSSDSSRWATEQRDENHWIIVDLGKVMTVNRVELYWENKTTRMMMVHQLSNDSGDLADEKYYLHIEPKQ